MIGRLFSNPSGAARGTLRDDDTLAQISGFHHLTLSTNGVQEDYDFYTMTLGRYSDKRTVLFDGVLPVYRLY